MSASGPHKPREASLRSLRCSPLPPALLPRSAILPCGMGSIGYSRSLLSLGLLDFASVHVAERAISAFGVWGACVYGVTPIEMGFSGVNYVGQCTKQGLGWTTRTVDTTQVADVAFGSLSWSLVLHPVACGAVIFSVVLLITLWLASLMGLPAWMHRKGQTMNQNFVDFLGIFASLFPLGMTITAAVLTTIVCIIDMIIVGEGISRAHKNPQAQTTVHFGGVPWLAFVAMLLTWIGVVEAYRASFTFSKWK
ncbi:hypothetical protein BS47DRAFT_1391640 [Hydnum rufescens UP504]|uniref:Uncharacterized protein n=1 Tax=Hydnum rufescens UP504 TaxID=1448309 RepID=A0A9P6DYZ8_9AGAM|nr:hypothetical protein BS47DRAFT_1391640 [Hydnum rufescens UP504]